MPLQGGHQRLAAAEEQLESALEAQLELQLQQRGGRQGGGSEDEDAFEGLQDGVFLGGWACAVRM
jgi:hypothetical protein